MTGRKVVIGRVLKQRASSDCCFRICGELSDLSVVRKLVTKTLSKSGFAVEIEGSS